MTRGPQWEVVGKGSPSSNPLAESFVLKLGEEICSWAPLILFKLGLRNLLESILSENEVFLFSGSSEIKLLVVLRPGHRKNLEKNKGQERDSNTKTCTG